jgi:hypothetical protein
MEVQQLTPSSALAGGTQQCRFASVVGDRNFDGAARELRSASSSQANSMAIWESKLLLT